jgi:hypothetical protein
MASERHARRRGHPVTSKPTLCREVVPVELGPQLGNVPLAQGIRAPEFG